MSARAAARAIGERMRLALRRVPVRPHRRLHRHAVVHAPPAQCRVLRRLHTAAISREPICSRPPAASSSSPRSSAPALRAPPGSRPPATSSSRALIYKESVASLDGFPDRWFDRGDGDLRRSISAALSPALRRRRAPAADGRAGFLLVQVAHALVEGADSALLAARNRPRIRQRSRASSRRRWSGPRPPVSARSSRASICSPPMSSPCRPGPIALRQPRIPRARCSPTLARAPTASASARCSTRSSCTPCSAVDGPARKRPSAHLLRRSTRAAAPTATPTCGCACASRCFANVERLPRLRPRGRCTRSPRSRPRRAASTPSSTPAAFACTVLSRLLPFAYGPKLFQFMPYDVVLGLIPPHRLARRAHAPV